MRRVILAVVLLLFWAFPALANYQTGLSAFQRGDYATALQEWLSLATQGDAKAQTALGFMYGNGWGVSKDYAQALQWYRKAAEQGEAWGQNNLGVMYRDGQGVPKDYAKAAEWYRKAAEQGNASAQNSLGVMYDNGLGVTKDYAEAARWFQKAAEQGYARARNNLGVMYENGRGVPQDYTEAFFWYSLAAANGDKVSAGWRDAAKAHLTSQQIAAVQARLRKWKPKKGQTEVAAASEPASTVSALPPSAAAGTPTNTSADLVTALQQRLTGLGYDPGPVDGIMGRKTRTAIRAFQRYAELPVTGEASDTLLERLNRKLATNEPDPAGSTAPEATDDSLRTFKGNSGWVWSVAFSGDGRYALSGAGDDPLMLWEVATGELIRTFVGHAGFVKSVALSSDGRYALSGGVYRLTLWDVATGRIVRSFEGHTGQVYSIAFSPDGRTALSGDTEHTLILWEVPSGKLVRTFEGHTETIYSVAFSPDGRFALSGASHFPILEGTRYGNTLKLWDVVTGSLVRTIKGPAINSVAFSPDGRFVLSGGSFGRLRHNHHESGKRPSGAFLLEQLNLWEVATGKLVRSFDGHSDYVTSVAISPDGRYALSGSADKTLKFWDIATGQEIQSFKGHADGVMSVAISPDGRYALSGSDDETLKLWDLGPYIEPALAAKTPPSKPVEQTSTMPVNLDFGAYHALVIGNNAYRALPRLETAINDARAVATTLRDHYGFNTTLVTDATRDTILDALDGLRDRLTTTDNLLIYYAGHGHLDREVDRGYWQPIDAKADSTSRWLSNATITDALKAIRAKHIMVVADSCFSGTLARSNPRGIKIEPHAPDFITQMLGKKSRTVLASGGLEPVTDSGGGDHSVFAKALLDALRDNRGVIDGVQVFARVREQVRLNAHQTPQYSNIRFAGHEVGGDFLFVRKPSMSQREQHTAVRVPARQNPAPEPVQPAVGVYPKTWKEPFTGMDFVRVPKGCFQMGSNSGGWEKPWHEVCVDGFWLGKYEVTQGEWRKVMSGNPSRFKKGDRYPVEKISWNDVQGFVRKLNARGSGVFRLPTEAEWEYACRSGGKREEYCGGSDARPVAWYVSNSNMSTHPVGTKAANGLGLHDMSGNVWEWVSDWYDRNYYSGSPGRNPQGPSSGSDRVKRGGSWFNTPAGVRSAVRSNWVPDARDSRAGFRLLRTP